MAYFAEIDNSGNVLRVVVVNDSVLTNDSGTRSSERGSEFITRMLGGSWIETDIEGNQNGDYASPDATYYDDTKAKFIPIQMSEEELALMESNEEQSE